MDYTTKDGNHFRLDKPLITGEDMGKNNKHNAEILSLRSEEQFHNLFKNAPVGMLLVDKNGDVLDANDKLLTILGSPGVGHTREINMLTFPPMIEAGISVAYQRCLETGEGVVVENLYTTKWGKETHLRSIVTPLFGVKGDVIGCISVMEDILVQKQTEAALQKSLSLLQATLESTADGILVVTNSKSIVLFNKRFKEMWAIPEDILATKSDDALLRFVSNQLVDTDSFLRNVNHLYSKPEAESVEILRFKDGRVFERYSKPKRINDTIKGRVWSFRDITKREQAEQAQKESERKYRLLFEKAPVGIILIDKDGKILEANQKLTDILGSPSIEATKQVNVITSQHMIEAEISKHYQHCIDGQKGTAFEVAYTSNWGKKSHIRMTLTSVANDETGINGCLGIYEDIFERRQAEEALIQSEGRFRNLFNAMKEVMDIAVRESDYIKHGETAEDKSRLPRSYDVITQENEILHIRDALRRTKGRVAPASRLLSMDRYLLRRKIKKLGIDTGEFK